MKVLHDISVLGWGRSRFNEKLPGVLRPELKLSVAPHDARIDYD